MRELVKALADAVRRVDRGQDAADDLTDAARTLVQAYRPARPVKTGGKVPLCFIAEAIPALSDVCECPDDQGSCMHAHENFCEREARYHVWDFSALDARTGRPEGSPLVLCRECLPL